MTQYYLPQKLQCEINRPYDFEQAKYIVEIKKDNIKKNVIAKFLAHLLHTLVKQGYEIKLEKKNLPEMSNDDSNQAI
jgi:Glu-tRNA(Gln) amidotransferase subunit E-like FAD-binding protein